MTIDHEREWRKLDRSRKLVNSFAIVSVTLVLLGLCFFVLICGGFLMSIQDRQLPNGYVFHPSFKEVGAYISHDGAGHVVPPTITKLDVLDDLVVGNVAYEELTCYSYRITSGYFLLDTITGEARLAMSRTEFDAALRERGISPDRVE